MNEPTEWDIHDLRGQGDLIAYLTAARQRAVADCKRRRARVLADPELAAQLTDVLRLANAAQWSGYVPPERDGNGWPNNSPIRIALAGLVAAAELREAS